MDFDEGSAFCGMFGSSHLMLGNARHAMRSWNKELFD
jgi:hypothetical protein